MKRSTGKRAVADELLNGTRPRIDDRLLDDVLGAEVDRGNAAAREPEETPKQLECVVLSDAEKRLAGEPNAAPGQT